MKTLKVIGAVLAAVLLFFVGRWSTMIGGDADPGQAQSRPAGAATGEGQPAAEPELWTCPMHPQIKLPDPGDCPICSMDLVPFVSDGLGPRQFAMSEASRKLARIETSVVERRSVTVPVRLVGKVDFDETAIKTIASRVSGRLDRLYVDYTGVPVGKGEHLVWLYSPDLLTAQEELLEAKKRLVNTKGEASEFLAASNRKAWSSSRAKLLLWGLTKEQVDEIETRGTAEDHMMITSPVSGIVIHKALNQGDYVKEGTRIYQIADLRHLWIRLDAYEQDLPWIRYGQKISIRTESLPGDALEGWISFIDPVLDPRTRTVKVRVNIANPKGRLKPGMFVRALLEAKVTGHGDVMDPSLAGKWICPMHPEVVEDQAGPCRICGMPLKKAEELGHIAVSESTKPLVVPVSAVLVTGKRAVVYLEVPGQKRPTYEGREVVLGARAGDHYIIKDGLREGDRVVTRGAFRIDSSLQILAKPSMMSQGREKAVYKGKESQPFRASFVPFYEGYHLVMEALAADDFAAAGKAWTKMEEALHGIDPVLLPRRAREVWDTEKVTLRSALATGAKAKDIEALRKPFEPISRSLISLEVIFGHQGPAKLYRAYCPMAFDDKGAPWIQRDDEIRNPYFGDAMYRCGDITDAYPGLAGGGR